MRTDQDLRDTHDSAESCTQLKEGQGNVVPDDAVQQPDVSSFDNPKKKNFSWHRLTPVRRRYVMTRNNKIRLRYITLSAVTALVFAGIIFKDSELPTWQKAQGNAPEEMAQQEAESGSPGTLQEKISSGIMQAAAVLTAPATKPKPEEPKFKENRTLILKSGQTLAGVLQKEGVSGPQAYRAVKAMSKHYDPRKIRPGQEISFKLKPVDGSETDVDLRQLVMKMDAIKSIKVAQGEGEKFTSEVVKKDVNLQTRTGEATIQTSVYGSAGKAGIPSAVTAELIRIYSWDVDFQRDIRQGDKIQMLYETHETDTGDVAKYGDILYASLTVGGVSIPVYRFKMKNGDIDYFTEDGWSIKKALMKTPIDGARLSSGFGMRKHPVLGYNKMHKGVDFAAPTGTPIYAAGDGTIDFKGRKGGYGNYIRIRHNSQIKTAYAHMHRFAKGMGTGKRVKQGQVIGYVGTTGRSTGPHLHYEVIKNGKQVNPNRVDLPTGEKLKGQDMKNLKAHIKKMKAQYAEVSKAS